MTTARDMIAKWLSEREAFLDPDGMADDIIASLLSAPESTRLELAWQLCPDLRYPADKPFPALPPEEKT